MKLTLNILEDISDTATGSVREVIAYISLLIIYFIFSLINKRIFPFGWETVVMMALICTPIGLIVTHSLWEAIFVGASIGMAVFGSIAFFSYQQKVFSIKDALLFTLAGIGMGMISNIMVYALFWKQPGVQKAVVRILDNWWKITIWYLIFLIIGVVVSILARR